MKQHFLLLLLALSALSDTLTVGIYHKPPYMDTKTNTGIVIDIFQEAATLAKIDYHYHDYPNKRLKLEISAGTIDMEPGISPIWRSDYDSVSLYTSSYLEVGNIILIRRSDTAAIKSVDDLLGKRIGTMRSFTYSEGFSEKFESGELIREDTDNQKQNILKLYYKRIDAVVIDKITFLAYLRELKLSQNEFFTLYTFRTVPLAMRIEKSLEDVRHGLEKALREMKRQNRIETLVKKYTDPVLDTLSGK